MDNGYVIENGEIKLTLSDADLESVLEDIKDCRTLLEPQIRLVGNTVIFRDHDLKLVDPITFFTKTIPILKIDLRQKLYLVLLCAIWPFYFTMLSIDKSLWLAAFNLCMGMLMAMIIYSARYNFLVGQHIRLHRKALYAKAKLLSFFYMTVLQESMTTSERLERAGNRLQRDNKELKQMYKDVISSLPSEYREEMPERFPDGEIIAPEVKKYS